MKRIKFTLLALFALVALLPASAAPIQSDSYGPGGAIIALGTGEVGSQSVWNSQSEITSKTGTLGGSEAGTFNWTMNYDVDPNFNWTFTSLMPGNYVVNFLMPVVGGPYNFLAHSAGGSITGIPGTTSIQNYMVVVEIPNGSPFGGGAFDLALPDTTAPTPFTVNIPVASQVGGIAPISPVSMGVTVSWTHVGPGVINLNGGLVLVDNAVPEPATFAVAGFALIGLALLRRRAA